MAELTGLPIPTMDWHSQDAPQAFKKFKARCELYFSGPLKDKSEEEKVSYLLIWSGDDGIELVSTWSLSTTDKKKLDTYWTRFENYLSPKSNFRLARYKLRTLKQEPGETVDSFVKKIRVLVEECRFTNPDEHIIDSLIFGSNSKRTQAKLLDKDTTLSLDTALDIARTEEATSNQIREITPDSSTRVDALKHGGLPDKPRGPTIRLCGCCGTEHDISERRYCPAYGSKCGTCGKENHWRKVCRSSKPHHQAHQRGGRGKYRKPPKGKPDGKKHFHSLEARDQTEGNPEASVPDQLYFHTLSVNQVTKSDTQAFLEVEVVSDHCKKPLSCKVDTGAEGNVISLITYKSLFPSSSCNSGGIPTSLAPSSTIITAFGGHAVGHYGTCVLKLAHGGSCKPYPFHVVDTDGPTILGLPTCTDLNLVTMNFSITNHEEVSKPNAQPRPVCDPDPVAKEEVLRQYKDCFEGVGCLKGEYHITVDPTVPPVVHPPRRVPEALREPLKKELDSLVDQGILAKVTEPTDWVNSLVCVAKNTGALWLCLDPKDLNCAIKRPHYFTPTLEVILPKLNGAKCFSILDARSGYWNIKLDQESSLLTTFNSPFGRHRFLRLPFGLICAQDIFQRKVDETFGDLTGVTGIADDIVVYGYNSDFSDHDENLRAVLQRARETGLRFNLDKCKFRCTRIPFFGHIIGAEGLQPDPRKIDSILSMDPSTSLADLQTFIGMVQFLSRFIPNLASLAASLWGLTKKTSDFVWSPEHQSATDHIKKAIVAPTSLQYFDNTQPVTIQVDASQRGLGAVLLQANGPVEFASKLLTETEGRYSNIEREMLAVLFGLEKFHYYAYGRPVVVESDHKPLEAIFKKHLSTAPPRIARMMLRIQKYDVQIKYVPGKDIPVADALSRISSCCGKAIQGLDVSIHEVHLHLNASPTRVSQIQEQTAKDTTLSALRKAVIMHGWPEKRSDCPAYLHAYWNYRDELTVADGLILKGTRIVIPESLQPDVLKQLHYAHQGAEKCKLRAKGSVFWANINRDIEELVKSCPPCQRHQKLNVKEPLLPHDVPQKPWHTLGSDIFFWLNANYLLVVDYYSKFPVVKKLTSIQSSTVIAHLKSVFEEHGIPSKLVTDNGSQYASAAFHEFNRNNGFTHVTSSPLYPQSNGLSERAVQTVKDLLYKCKESGQDPHLAMLCLRSTPLSHDYHHLQNY